MKTAEEWVKSWDFPSNPAIINDTWIAVVKQIQQDARKELKNPLTRTELALANLLEFAKGNRGSRSGNPYLVPEVQEALGALAQAQGLPDDYDSRMSVDTQAICERK